MRRLFAAVVALVAVAAMAQDDVFPRFICRLPLYPASADFDDVLIENAQNGDHSAVALLERRYAEAPTASERIHLGSALLGRAADDSAIWKELAAYAESYVDEQKLEAKQAFDEIARDRRARPLLLRALASKDWEMVNKAILGLSLHRDDATLPDIEKALQRFPEEASMAALSLIDFNTEAADTLAKKYLRNDDVELYDQEQAGR